MFYDFRSVAHVSFSSRVILFRWLYCGFLRVLALCLFTWLLNICVFLFTLIPRLNLTDFLLCRSYIVFMLTREVCRLSRSVWWRRITEDAGCTSFTLLYLNPLYACWCSGRATGSGRLMDAEVGFWQPF